MQRELEIGRLSAELAGRDEIIERQRLRIVELRAALAEKVEQGQMGKLANPPGCNPGVQAAGAGSSPALPTTSADVSGASKWLLGVAMSVIDGDARSCIEFVARLRKRVGA